VLLRENDRRGAEAVAREHARRLRAGRKAHHQQVLATGLLDACHRHAQIDTGDLVQGAGFRRRQVHGHPLRP
jgi:hypothetical protein